MKQSIDTRNHDEVLAKALTKIRELRAKVEALETASAEPVAIVGMACRLPGDNDSPEALWKFLLERGDGTTIFPEHRLRDADERARLPRGGFLADVERFDAALFGISPREAMVLDPQQRLFLEVAWQALEHAGQRFSALGESSTGVFVGVTNSDYCQRMLQELPESELDAYCLTSNASTFAAGRLSYTLGLRGPSLSIDTACSSSLVSVHMACQSLRASDCSMALAGGVNVLLSPEWFSVLTRAGMMAPDGHCKTFDRRADGYVRSEGCVVFVLKRLSDAQAAGDHIHAVLRGSSVNQDGKSAGITVPNGKAQEEAIRGALRMARLAPEDVDYVEAHGTGTPLGDPIEVRALSRVLCSEAAREAPLRIGSVKSNLGHLEPAAGALGLLKAVLALEHQELPPQALLDELNPELDLTELGVEIPRERQPWPRGPRPRVAGVSSFGASGTNAHVLVEEAPAVEPVAILADRPVHLAVVAARSAQALDALLERHASHLERNPHESLADVCHTLGGRAQLPERFAVVAGSLGELREALRAAATGVTPRGSSRGRVQAAQAPRIAFLFTGQGSQYAGMALSLHHTEPVFRRALDRCAAILGTHLDVPLLTVLRDQGETSYLAQTRYTQPALFAVEYALAELWRAWGIVPEAVLGHSVGEYVALCVAGALSLDDALALLVKRAALMQALEERGAMASVFASAEAVAPVLARFSQALALAAVNGPDSVVLSGAEGALEQALSELTASGIKSKRLSVSHAFHSPLLEPMLDALEGCARDVRFGAPEIPCISNLTGLPIERDTLSARYVRDHARAPVLFYQSIQWLLTQGFDTFVEVGPSPNLSSMARRFAPEAGTLFLPSLRSGVDDTRSMLESLGALHVRGAEVDFVSFDADHPRRRRPLPTYPFERKPYWYRRSAARGKSESARRSALPAGVSRLLGHRVSSPLASAQFETAYGPEVDPCLGDCVMGGQRVVNVGVYLEAATQAQVAVHGATEACAVRGLTVRAGFVLEDQPRDVQVTLRPGEGELSRFALHSRAAGADDAAVWVLHADAQIAREASEPARLDVPALLARGAAETDGSTFYRQMQERQLELGESARWIDGVAGSSLEAVARMRAPSQAESDGYRIAPGLVDAAFQTLFAALPADIPGDAIYMIVEVERLVLGKAARGESVCHARIRAGGDIKQLFVADLDLADAEGKVFLRIEGALLKRTTVEALRHASSRTATPARASGATRVRDELLALAPAQLPEQVLAWLRSRLSSVLRADEAELDVSAPLAALGFDSLMAVEVKNLAGQELGVELPLSELLVEATIRDLSQSLLRLLQRGQGAEQHVAAQPAPAPVLAVEPSQAQRFEPFPLTDLQQAYLLGRTRAFELGGVSTYFFLEVDLEGVDVDRLEASLNTLIGRHDQLRAVATPDGQQRVLEQVPPYHIRRVDVRNRSARQVAETLLAVHQECKGQTFDPQRFPLFDVRATLLPEGVTRLHLGFDALVIDAWSTSMLFREWVTVYRDGDVRALPALDLTFRDYVMAQRAQAESARHQAAAQYWRARIPTLPPAPPLPLAKSPASVENPVFAHRAHRLSRAQSEALKTRAREAGVTPSAVLCAAYAEVLATWSNSSAFTLNLLFFNRAPVHPHVDRVLGNFSATTLLEVHVSRGDDLRTSALRLQKQLAEDLDHHEFSGIQVLRELNQGGDPRRARMPVVFASTINFHNRQGEAPTGLAQHLVSMGERGEEVHSSIRTPQVWLDHQVVEDSGGIVLNWDAVEELFAPGMLDDMFAAYVTLVTRLCDDDRAFSERQRLLVPETQLRLREEANLTGAPLPQGLLHEPFVRAAALLPERPAVLSDRRCLSYGELDRASNRIAHWLRSHKAPLGRFVAVVMERGWEQVVAVLGVLKAGAAYVPIDAHLPEQRRAYLLEQTESPLVLSQSWLGLRDTELGRPVLHVDELDRSGLPVTPVHSTQKPEDLAYVIYTSGSTGMPKGVMIEHRSALNTVLDVNQRFGITADSRVLALSALNFDLSVWDVFGVLAAGGAVVLPEPDALREPAAWLSLVERHGVNVWNSVPALMEMFTDYLTGCDATVPDLKVVMMSGDWIPVGLPERIRTRAPSAKLWSMGGATEAAIWSIVYPIHTVEPHWASIPYGKAMLNQQMHVLDEGLAPCPVWVTGHIYIGGVGLARGYLNDAEKTRNSFIRHPATGERLYRTGDLGRLLPSGDIEFLGRADSQVKVQGFRIELGEIEAALLSHPGVRAAAAAAIGEKRGAKRLCAFVVPHGEAPSPEELRELLLSRLPEYAVPPTIKVIDALPLSANGKVDRGALAALESHEAEEGRAFMAPRTELERTLVGIWQELLGRQVSVSHSFFDLGGNSLLAVRLMARIRQELGVELPLASLFESPTVELLAMRVVREQTGGDAGRDPLVPIQRGGDRVPFFCVHPVGGSVFCYRELSRLLGSHQPFWGLASHDQGEPLSLEALAQRYVQAIKRAQPEGPYRVGGWSMGGAVAYEIAQQLAAHGDVVEVVALIDVIEPPVDTTSGEHASLDEADLLAWLVSDLGYIANRKVEVSAGELRPLTAAQRIRRVGELLRTSGLLGAEVDDRGLEDIVGIFRRNLRALFAYEAKPYPGKVWFCRGTRPGGASLDNARHWLSLAHEGTLVELDADHYGLFGEQLGALAQALGSELTAASARGEVP